jgi:hypothetical protein
MGPLVDVRDADHGEEEVGRTPSGLDQSQCLVDKLLVRVEDELDLLPTVLLERRNDLPDRLVLLVVLSLLPAHHEIGALCAERRDGQRRGKNQNPASHERLSLKRPA